MMRQFTREAVAISAQVYPRCGVSDNERGPMDTLAALEGAELYILTRSCDGGGFHAMPTSSAASSVCEAYTVSLSSPCFGEPANTT